MHLSWGSWWEGGGEIWAGCLGGEEGELWRGLNVDVHHVTLVVLVVTQRQQDDVALVDPDLLAKLAADVAESAGSVEALRLQAAVSKMSSARVSPALSWPVGGSVWGGETAGWPLPGLGP